MNPRFPPNSNPAEDYYELCHADAYSRETWVTADGRAIPIADMSEQHIRNALAMIMRHARRGFYWRISDRPRGRGRLIRKRIDYPG